MKLSSDLLMPVREDVVIVHVKMNEGVPVENLYDAVWVEGIFSTTRYSSDLAAAGYSMQGEAVHPY